MSAESAIGHAADCWSAIVLRAESFWRNDLATKNFVAESNGGGLKAKGSLRWLALCTVSNEILSESYMIFRIQSS